MILLIELMNLIKLFQMCDLSCKNILNGSRLNAERTGEQTGDKRLGKPFETGTVNG